MRTIGLAIDTFMHATAWPMERPAAYGLFHLSFTFIGLALVIFLAWRLRNLKSKGQRALLFACGVFLLVCEVYKQLFHYYFINDHAYAWWIFPFYLCSVPMYLCLIAPWLKAGKLQRALYTFLAGVGNVTFVAIPLFQVFLPTHAVMVAVLHGASQDPLIWSIYNPLLISSQSKESVSIKSIVTNRNSAYCEIRVTASNICCLSLAEQYIRPS